MIQNNVKKEDPRPQSFVILSEVENPNRLTVKEEPMEAEKTSYPNLGMKIKENTRTLALGSVVKRERSNR